MIMNVEYRCRRCLQVYTASVGKKEIVERCFVSLITGINELMPKHGVIPTLLNQHGCEDGGIGISDIIGARKDTTHAP